MFDHASQRAFTFTTAANLPVRDVRAPACPVGSQATWAQITVAFASVALFAVLLIGAFTRDPVSLPGAGLALIGFTVTSWIAASAVKSRMRPRYRS